MAPRLRKRGSVAALGSQWIDGFQRLRGGAGRWVRYWIRNGARTDKQPTMSNDVTKAPTAPTRVTAAMYCKGAQLASGSKYCS